jgi:hypothetical protein
MQSAGAQRRNQRAVKRRSNSTSWIAIGAVVVIIAVFLAIKLGGSSTPTTNQSGIASGQTPVLASVSQMVQPVATIPLSVYNSVGTAGQLPIFSATKGQPALKVGALPRFVYAGAEFCPYCAMARWSMVAALSRFGTFSNLKMTSSANSDYDITTFSFFHSSYTSKYLVFSAYEQLDRNHNPLETVPSDVLSLYLKYDGNDSTNVAAAPFNPGGVGIPFFDVANRYVSSGWPNYFLPTLDALSGGGPDATQAASAAAIAAAMHDPSSPVASAIHANLLIGMANTLSATFCSVDGQQPSSVCASSGVKAAAKDLAALKPVG